MINKKIKADLQSRGRSAPNMEAKILSILKSAPDQVFTLRDICNKNGQHNGSFWGAAYHLASQGLIGFADRKYHVWGASKLSTYSMRIRTVVWHKDLEIKNVVVRDQWVDLLSTQVQAPLFAGDVATLSNSDLDKLIERVQKERFERILKARYEGGDVNTCKPVSEVLRAIGVADPVVYMHSDQSCTFVTMTSTKEMPIKITIKSKDLFARTIANIEHITLHGLPVVATLKNAFEGGD